MKYNISGDTSSSWLKYYTVFSFWLGDGEWPRVSPGWILPVNVDVIAGCNGEFTYCLSEFLKANLYVCEIIEIF